MNDPTALIAFFNATATTEIYTLSLHDALPIYRAVETIMTPAVVSCASSDGVDQVAQADRKSTRLNSSHANISYAVFCLKKKKRRRQVQEAHGCGRRGKRPRAYARLRYAQR